jgi:transcriptional regulator with XRE-family HTH domain
LGDYTSILSVPPKAWVAIGGKPRLAMFIGERIRAIREAKNLSQGDIENRCGLVRCYVSRIENGHTVPVVETLEKFARALEVPLYQLFYEGKEPPKSSHVKGAKGAADTVWGRSRKEINYWKTLCRLLTRMPESDRRLLLQIVQKMARR